MVLDFFSFSTGGGLRGPTKRANPVAKWTQRVKSTRVFVEFRARDGASSGHLDATTITPDSGRRRVRIWTLGTTRSGRKLSSGGKLRSAKNVRRNRAWTGTGVPWPPPPNEPFRRGVMNARVKLAPPLCCATDFEYLRRYFANYLLKFAVWFLELAYLPIFHKKSFSINGCRLRANTTISLRLQTFTGISRARNF